MAQRLCSVSRSLTASSARVFYDDAEHVYRLDGVPVPSVTQALTLTGRIDTSWFTPEAAERGRRIHTYAELLDTRTIDGVSFVRDREIPDAIGGYVEAYRAMRRDVRPVYDAIEQACWHPQLRYGGRPDRGCRRIFGGPGTLELKSGGEADWHGVQLAGYERLRRRGGRWVCYLQANGRYKIRQCRAADDHHEFLRALRDVWARWPQPLAQGA